MSVKTKAGGVAATVLLIAGGWSAANMQDPPGSQNAQHRAPANLEAHVRQGTRPGTVIRMVVSWQRPYTPNRITTFANDGRQDYVGAAIVDTGWRFERSYGYQPGTTYSVDADQGHADAKGTLCQIFVGGVLADHDSKDGASRISCVVQG